jgi:hypothetical protein
MSTSKFSKVTIYSIESGDKVVAQYNPKELSFSKNVNYTDNQSDGRDYPTLYFTAGQAISVSVELFFDRYEDNGDVRGDVGAVLKLCLIDSSLKRPPMVQFLWGEKSPFGDSPFYGVITDASVKYTMFNDSTPVRASVTVSIKQADTVTVKNGSNSKTGTETSISSVDTGSKSVQDVSNDPALTNALLRAGADPADKSTWPSKVDVTSSKSVSTEESTEG